MRCTVYKISGVQHPSKTNWCTPDVSVKVPHTAVKYVCVLNVNSLVNNCSSVGQSKSEDILRTSNISKILNYNIMLVKLTPRLRKFVLDFFLLNNMFIFGSLAKFKINLFHHQLLCPQSSALGNERQVKLHLEELPFLREISFHT